MWGKIQAHLCDDARHWYKLWSSWLALLWGGICFAIAEEPTTLQQALSLLPPEYHKLLPPAVFLFASALPIIVRCLKQGGLKK